MKLKKIIVAVIVILLFSVTVFASNEVDWNSNEVTADGYGSAPPNAVTPAQANILARRAAVVDAQRNLLEVVQGVNLDAQTTVENAMIANDTISSSVKGFLKGAKVIKEEWTPEGAYHVVMAVRLFGKDSLAAAVVTKTGLGGGSRPPSFPAPGAVPVPSVKLPETNPETLTLDYSGLIIDCRGMALERAMAPVIMDEDGRIIYSSRFLRDDVLVSSGMCDYEDNAQSNYSRSGSNPLRMKAMKLRDFNRNIVVSRKDGNTILGANKKTKILDNTRVVFLCD